MAPTPKSTAKAPDSAEAAADRARERKIILIDNVHDIAAIVDVLNGTVCRSMETAGERDPDELLRYSRVLSVVSALLERTAMNLDACVVR